MNKTIKAWVQAFRPRTLPLSLSTLFLGAGLAAVANAFSVWILIFSVLTATFLQALSDLANDYGDAHNNVDGADRVGPERTVSSGKINPSAMRLGIALVICLVLISASLLFYFSFGTNLIKWLCFSILLAFAIWAAMAYTMGKKPYGYRARGDYYVFVFFGLVSVLGSFYLFTGNLINAPFLPAIAAGLFSTAVLNINNIRDIEGDRKHGKQTIALRLGPKNSRIYHLCLVGGGTVAWTLYLLMTFNSWEMLLILLTLPLIISAYKVFNTHDAQILDAQLRNTALGIAFLHICMAIVLPLLA